MFMLCILCLRVWFSSGVPLVVRTKGFSPVDNFVLQFSFAEFDREKLSVANGNYTFVPKFGFVKKKLRFKLRMTVFVWVWDYKFMARVADKIKLIDGSREALKLSIRITDLWYIGIPGKTEQVEMVVIDSDGDEIDVVCKQDQLKSRKADLKENLTYFFSYLNDIEDERAIVILLTHARIKEAQGSYPASVSNSFKASKLMINDLVLEIQEFRERKSNVSFFKQEFVCVIVAKITTIVMDNYSWCYPACGQCYKKADMQTVPFTCPSGKENDQPVLRNSVVLKYSDESDLINAVLDMIPDSEQSLSITADHDGSMLSSSLPTEFESQSVSVTGDHDPLLRIPLTPTKHVSSDELDNEQKNFQISRAEVSSNKLAKHS
ncbi:hypothetical protein JHK84_053033 [Glycine max]|nr:hypothetical protein JHK84_053033 [Glycine max]